MPQSVTFYPVDFTKYYRGVIPDGMTMDRHSVDCVTVAKTCLKNVNGGLWISLCFEMDLGRLAVWRM